MGLTDSSRKIEFALLGPDVEGPAVHRLCADAIEQRVAGVWVTPVWVGRVATMLRGSEVAVTAAISFPHGTAKATLKAIEATSSIKDGADAVAVVAHLPPLLNRTSDATRAELMEVVRASRATRRDVVVKVIVESAWLLSAGATPTAAGAAGPEGGWRALEVACQAVRESGCDVIATATGFHPAGGASVAAVRWLKQFAGEFIRVQASGGIHDRVAAETLLAAGADLVAVTVPAWSNRQ